jgi:translation elongation factor EF-Tu-like GTPase
MSLQAVPAGERGRSAAQGSKMRRAFQFIITDVMYIGPGDMVLPLTAVIGRLEEGAVRTGDTIEVPAAGGDVFTRVVQCLEVLNRTFHEAEVGKEPVDFAILLRDQPARRDVAVGGRAVGYRAEPNAAPDTGHM